jgi:hypothetical protein
MRFRPRIRRLLDELIGDTPAELVSINYTRIEEATGVSRQTIHNWVKADVDDPEAWLTRYDGETAHRLREYFSKLFGREVEIIDRIEIEASPRFQETSTIAVSAA